MMLHSKKACLRLYTILSCIILCLCLLMPVRFHAEEAETNTTETEAAAAQEQTETKTETPVVKKKKKKKKKIKNANKWIKKDGYYYYYNEKGKKLTGMKKVGKKTYLFDRQGRQCHGWHKVKNAYYYFYLTPGKKGCMAQKTMINSIYLRKNGMAKVTSGSQRLYCLLRASEIVGNCTKPTWSKSEKMRAAWNYMQNNFWYANVYYYYSSGWGAYYGYLCFSQRGGSCEGLGCAWAFLANACGADNCYCVCSGGHGWAEVGGLAYDPACARYDYYRSDYYGLPSWRWGNGGIPNYHVGCYRWKV